LAVGYSSTEAFVMPSPGHEGTALFQIFDPFIFPMDQVRLKDLSESSCLFALASTELAHVDAVFVDQFLPKLRGLVSDPSSFRSVVLPKQRESLKMNLGESSKGRLLILPHIGLPECAMVGYTFLFLNDEKNIGNDVWQHLIGDNNPRGPVEVKGLEYESLRIEAGQPAFGHEVTGAWKEPEITSPTPLELHQNAGVIDVSKGCYLGQEGIASVMKNPRGPPRSLYAIVFEDDDNGYQHLSEGDESDVENLTKIPRRGDKLFVLGSNEEIQVGVITSIAEPQSTGDPTIVGLGLMRRPDSILKQMKSKELQIPRGIASSFSTMPVDLAAIDSPSGIIPPPPLDSLHGLEVIVGGTFTIGMLRSLPSRRLPNGKNMFVDQEQVFLTREEMLDQGYVDIEFSDMSATELIDEKLTEFAIDSGMNSNKSELVAADEDQKDAGAKPIADDTAEAEAKRKAAKMEILKQQAEEALARRRRKKQEQNEPAVDVSEEIVGSVDTPDEEAKRKAEKMMSLQKRAEEAIARRRQKKESQ
jgi:hypothetical protein